MVNPSKRKGSTWAKEWCTYLAEIFPGVERRVDGGCRDRGDVAGLPAWCLELKNERALALAAAMNEAEIERRNAGARWCAAVLKRRMYPARDAYVVLPGWVFREVLAELEKR